MSRNRDFQKVKAPNWKLNEFDLSHQKLLTSVPGDLIPVFYLNCIPGDQVSVSTEVFIRFAPMLAPLASRWEATVHFFFVNYRSLWTNWIDFITGGDDGQTVPTPPYITMDAANKAYFDEGRLADYFGLPCYSGVGAPTQDVDINVLPFIAYQHIWDEYYRDEDLQTARLTLRKNKVSNGDQQANIANILSRCQRNWERDYLMGARPYAQKGVDTELDLDVFENAATTYFRKQSGAVPTAGAVTVDAAGAIFDGTPDAIELKRESGSNQLSNFTSIIELPELRRAEALQKFMEASMRGGTRYEEVIAGVFGVVPPYLDEIPRYLGGGRQYVQSSEVMSNTTTLDNAANPGESVWTPIGEYTGRSVSIGKTNKVGYKCREHGIIIGLLSVVPRLTWGSEGIPRLFRYDDRFDYPTPYLMNVGDQEVLQSEVYWDPVGVDMDDTWGYQERYGEAKGIPSTVHGAFRTSLDYWHSAILCGAAPALNDAFITCSEIDDELTRMFATPTADEHLYINVWNNCRALRPMPKVAIPTL